MYSVLQKNINVRKSVLEFLEKTEENFSEIHNKIARSNGQKMKHEKF